MKQSAAKTLGVAALGAAFAAAAAGTATAAPAALPVGPDVLGVVTGVVPLGDDLTELPAGAAEAVAGGEGALGLGADQGVKTLPAVADQGVKTLPSAADQGVKALPSVTDQATQVPLDGVQSGLGATPLGQATGLLGGLPLNGLPLNGLGV
ncbi:hypothetical protein ACIGEZ_11335 [Streptomyces sp. NPDC085481]|uniref:hypothetical protein n=1 Tax=Streptomyces sp. NPDC085481 TaxID=3365727 RepID=UPI0037D42F5E